MNRASLRIPSVVVIHENVWILRDIVTVRNREREAMMWEGVSPPLHLMKGGPHHRLLSAYVSVRMVLVFIGCARHLPAGVRWLSGEPLLHIPQVPRVDIGVDRGLLPICARHRRCPPR